MHRMPYTSQTLHIQTKLSSNTHQKHLDPALNLKKTYSSLATILSYNALLNVAQWIIHKVPTQMANCLGCFFRLIDLSVWEMMWVALLLRSLHSWSTSRKKNKRSSFSQLGQTKLRLLNTNDSHWKSSFIKSLTIKLFVGFFDNSIVWPLYFPVAVLHPGFTIRMFYKLAVLVNTG